MSYEQPRYGAHRADDEPTFADRTRRVGQGRAFPPIEDTDPRQPIRRELVVPRDLSNFSPLPPAEEEDPLLELKRSFLRTWIYVGILVGMLAIFLMGMIVSTVVAKWLSAG